MNSTRLSAAVAALLLTTAGIGCGGLTTQSFCQQYTTDSENRILQCTGAPSDTKSEIEALLGIDAQSVCAPIEAAVKAKRATFNAAKAQDCLNQIETLPCAQLFAAPPQACTDSVIGAVKDGGACYNAIDCQPAGYCDATGQTCPGKCHTFVAAGGDCSGAGSQCISGTYCEATGQTCKTDVAQGGSCDANGSTSCASGLHCTASGGSSGTCQPPPGVGDACGGSGANQSCGFGTKCVNGTCQAPKTVNQSCSSDAECGFFTSCLSGKCTEWPKVGGTCGQQGQSVIGCLGSFCKPDSPGATTGTCTAYLKTGDSCSAYQGSGACGPGSYCDQTNGCTANASSGATCSEPSP